MFEFLLPDLGEGIHEGELIVWHVKEEEHVKEDDPLCDMETDKATVTIPCPRTGRVVRLSGSPGDTIHVGDVLAVIDESGVVSQDSGKDVSMAAVPEKTENFLRSKRVAAAPATRRLARELNVDITMVQGTGAGGKVTPQDVRAAVQKGAEDTKDEDSPVIEPKAADRSIKSGKGIPFLDVGPLPDFSDYGSIEIVPIRSLRKKTASKTTTSAILIPHVAHMDEWDVTEFENLRRKMKQAGGGHLTLLSFIMKAAAFLLKQYPEFNASVDPDRMVIIQKKYYHLGFAADTPRGLMVPVIKNADQKSVRQIAGEIRKLAQKGQDNTIETKELSGSTFTITNVGVIGGTGVFPIINYPESAILGLGRVADKPVARDDAVVIRKILPATLSFDHRTADGARAARFMRDLKERLEDPMVYLTNI